MNMTIIYGESKHTVVTRVVLIQMNGIVSYITPRYLRGERHSKTFRALNKQFLAIPSDKLISKV